MRDSPLSLRMSPYLRDLIPCLMERHGIGNPSDYLRTLMRNDALSKAPLNVAASFNHLSIPEQAKVDQTLLKRIQSKPQPRGTLLSRMAKKAPESNVNRQASIVAVIIDGERMNQQKPQAHTVPPPPPPPPLVN